MSNTQVVNWEYYIKCRLCGKMEQMHHSTSDIISRYDFEAWIDEHSAFPLKRKCSCASHIKREIILLHDIVGFTGNPTE